MLIAPKFLDYERPEGHLPRDPEVLVRRQVIEQFGMPTVNYGSLGQLMMEELGFRSDHTPVISIYSRLNNYDNPINPIRLHRGIDDYSYRWGKTLHVNADTRADRFSSKPYNIVSDHVMRGVIVQAAAYACAKQESDLNPLRDPKLRRMTLLIAGGAAASIATGVALGSESLAGVGVFGAVGGGVIMHVGRKTVLKYRAHQAIPEYMPDHQQDIVFPV